MSLSDTSRQLVWIKALLSELGVKMGPIPLCGDNQGSIFMASNPVQEHRIRAHVAQTVVMLVRISCKKAVRVGKAHVDP